MAATRGMSSEIEVKKALVTGRLQKREDERLADVQKRKDKKDNTVAANENVDSFISKFVQFKCELETGITNSNGMSKVNLPSHFDSLSVSLQDMQKFLSDATVFLAPYEIQKSQETIARLQTEIQTKREELIPKKKFAFKGKKKLESVIKGEHVSITNKPVKDINVDMVDCRFADMDQEQLCKQNEEINNKDLALSNLENCTVKLVGSPSAIHINKLTGCKVFSGPVSGSVIIDDCTNCTFVLACQQLRIHCTTLSNFYIHVTSKAIIEDSQKVEFAPYNWKYEGLDTDYDISGLDQNRNNWNDVDDFNWLASDTKSPNWNVMDESLRVHDWKI